MEIQLKLKNNYIFLGLLIMFIITKQLNRNIEIQDINDQI